jgi:hypothetical protein
VQSLRLRRPRERRHILHNRIVLPSGLPCGPASVGVGCAACGGDRHRNCGIVPGRPTLLILDYPRWTAGRPAGVPPVHTPRTVSELCGGAWVQCSSLLISRSAILAWSPTMPEHSFRAIDDLIRRAERAAAAAPDRLRLVAELVKLIGDDGADLTCLVSCSKARYIHSPSTSRRSGRARLRRSSGGSWWSG